jgi:hypothetical protein
VVAAGVSKDATLGDEVLGDQTVDGVPGVRHSLTWLRDVIPAADAIAQLSSGDGPARIANLVGTGGVSAARPFQLTATADRADGLDPTLGLLQLGHLDTTLQSSHSRIVDETDIG